MTLLQEREEADTKAREEAEKKQQELEEKLKREEEERLARKKRIEEIMARTRGKGGSTTPTSTPKKVNRRSLRKRVGAGSGSVRQSCVSGLCPPLLGHGRGSKIVSALKTSTAKKTHWPEMLWERRKGN